MWPIQFIGILSPYVFVFISLGNCVFEYHQATSRTFCQCVISDKADVQLMDADRMWIYGMLWFIRSCIKSWSWFIKSSSTSYYHHSSASSFFPLIWACFTKSSSTSYNCHSSASSSIPLIWACFLFLKKISCNKEAFFGFSGYFVPNRSAFW